MKNWFALLKLTYTKKTTVFILFMASLLYMFGLLIFIVQALVQEELINIVHSHSTSAFISTIAYIFIIYLAFSILFGLSYYAGEHFNRKQEFSLKNRLFTQLKNVSYKHISKMDLESFIKIMTDDIQAVVYHSTWAIINLFSTFVIGAIAMVYLWKISALLTIAMLVIAVIHLLVILRVTKRQKELEIENRENNIQLEGEIERTISMYEVWQNTKRRQWKLDRFTTHRQKQAETHIKLQFYYFYLEFSQLFINRILPIVLAFYLFFLIINGQSSFGALFALQLLSIRVIAPFTELTHVLFNYRSVVNSYEKLNQLFSLQQDNRQTAHELINNHLNPIIEVKGLSYINNGENLFSGLSFHIFKGEKIHLTGKSGTGKTTLARIMVGLLQQTEGSVLIYNQPVTQYSQQALFSILGYVPQQVETFHIDINAIKDTALYRQLFYKQEIQDPLALSEGEKQLLQFCYVMSYSPQILVLDEWVSSIDMGRRQKIYEALHAYNGAVILISHLEEKLSFITRKIELVK